MLYNVMHRVDQASDWLIEKTRIAEVGISIRSRDMRYISINRSKLELASITSEDEVIGRGDVTDAVSYMDRNLRHGLQQEAWTNGFSVALLPATVGKNTSPFEVFYCTSIYNGQPVIITITRLLSQSHLRLVPDRLFPRLSSVA